MYTGFVLIYFKDKFLIFFFCLLIVVGRGVYIEKKHVFHNNSAITSKKRNMENIWIVFNDKKRRLPFTFTPRIEENVGVGFWVPAGAEYTIGGPDSNVHAEFPHNALRGRLDGQPDRPVLSADDFGPPFATSQLRNDRNWDVGSLVLLRVAPYAKKEQV